jgi:hypothetical protein
VVLGCALAVSAAMLGYVRVFAFFSSNDDEGYILQTIRSYLEGHRLFADVFTQYGPAFYVLESLIHQTLRAPLTHDFERLATVGLWVAASLASAATVLRLTRSSIAAALTLAGVFVHLAPLIGEPGHPQGPLVLVIALVALIAAWDREDTLSTRQVAAIGVLTAFAVLVKVNVGLYLALGFAIPVLFAVRLSRTRINAALLTGVAIVACFLPVVVARNHLRGWAFNYALITSLSLAATVIAIARPRRASLPFRTLARYVFAVAVAGALLVVPVLIRGTSIPALLNGILLRPSQFDRIFFMPLVLPATSLVAGSAGVLLSIVWVFSVASGRPPRLLAVAAAKILVAAAGLYLCRAGLGSQLAYFTPFLWIVTLPAGAAVWSRVAVGRNVLAFVAVFQSLQAYPVAGSQLAFATFLMIPISFVCAFDALSALRQRLGNTRTVSWTLHTAFAVAGIVFYRPVLSPTAWRAPYDAGYELRLPGATQLRLPGGDVARYHWLSGTVAANCGALLTLPGLYSLNAWSGVETVTDLNATAWMTLLTAAEQESVWRAVDASSRTCAVYNPTLEANWLGGRPLETLPSHHEMTARFDVVAEADGYRLLMRRTDVPPSGIVMRLVAGRQTFERRRSPLPVLAAFIVPPTTSTLRVWIKSNRTGVVLGCQSQEHAGLPSSRWLPMLYIGHTGRLYGQHWTAAMQVNATARAVNDGRWHHVVLAREENVQRFYVDGDLVGASSATIETSGLSSCQVGTGATSLWPDGPTGWMPFNGAIEGFAVSLRAWKAGEIAEDWIRTRPVE